MHPSLSYNDMRATFSLTVPLFIASVFFDVEKRESTQAVKPSSRFLSVPVEFDHIVHVRIFSSAARTVATTVAVIANCLKTNKSAHSCSSVSGIYVDLSASSVALHNGNVLDTSNRSRGVSSIFSAGHPLV